MKPISSIGGWVVIVIGVHEEASEDDIQEAFEGYGEITNIHMNLDRRTGYAKGYALVEFVKQSEAESAVISRDVTILGQKVIADFAFYS